MRKAEFFIVFFLFLKIFGNFRKISSKTEKQKSKIFTPGVVCGEQILESNSGQSSSREISRILAV